MSYKVNGEKKKRKNKQKKKEEEVHGMKNTKLAEVSVPVSKRS